MSTLPRHTFGPGTGRATWLMSFLTAALVACGGGGSSSTAPPPVARTSFTSGAITGFGSVIVNGVRFDDSAAEVVDDEGRAHGRDDLALGVQVEVEASEIDRAAGQGVATRIRFGSEIVGAVEAIDPAAQRLTVLGQPVVVTARTAVDDSLPGGWPAVAVGTVVEVHARFDAAQGAYIASRLEAAGAPEEFKLRGLVSALDAAGRTFRIGDALIDYGGVGTLPQQLADGMRVRVILQTAPSNGRWLATDIRSAERAPQDHGEAEVKGLISAFTSATRFSVDGLAVHASGASFPEGQAGVVLGALVEVEGAIVDGVLVATRVHLEDEDEEQEHERGEDFELHGLVDSLDAAGRRFSLRGVTVSFGDATVWRDLTESALANGLSVEVKGVLSSGGTQLQATRISLED